MVRFYICTNVFISIEIVLFGIHFKLRLDLTHLIKGSNVLGEWNLYRELKLHFQIQFIFSYHIFIIFKFGKLFERSIVIAILFFF